MIRFAALMALALGFAAPAYAQDPAVVARVEQLDHEMRGYQFPGPRQGEIRPVWVWRPSSAPATATLPVLYMMDGEDGIRIAILDLKAQIEAGTVQPILLVGINANPDGQQRAAEYVHGWPGGSDDFAVHSNWFLTQVIPWAERTQRASNERAHRFVGGFSNGADFAIEIAGEHPDEFAGVLVHSPVGANPGWIRDNAAQMRWVLTGGTQEQAGSMHRGGDLPRRISQALLRRNVPLRRCIGSWVHEGRIWRQLSPGSVTWLMGLGDVAAAESPFEKGRCTVTP